MKWLTKLFGEQVNDCKIDGRNIFLFWDGTQHYPAWSNNGNEQYVWPMVREAVHHDNRHRMDLMLMSGEVYTFIEEEKMGSFHSYSITKTVELYCNKNIISSFVLELRHDDYELFSVEFIKEGRWEKDIADFLTWKKGNDELMRRNLDEMMERSRISKLSKTLDI